MCSSTIEAERDRPPKCCLLLWIARCYTAKSFLCVARMHATEKPETLHYRVAAATPDPPGAPPIRRATSQREGVQLRLQVLCCLFALQPFIAPFVPTGFVPKLTSINLTNEHSVTLQLCELAQLGRE